ncbi:MAG: glycosyltransferase family 2 protein, partial [Chloroflexota bacterium]|nr:glycosyltransferase family 2 protein [Chloroflexota bacterium]
MPLRPIRLLQVDIGERLLDIPWPARTWRDPAPPGLAVDAARSGEEYGSALVLVRLHDQPLGLVELPAPATGHREIRADDYAGTIWGALGGAINRHLEEDGLPQVAGLTRDGVSAGPARCRLERDALLADAPMVSVIIPTRDRPDWLADCLRSLVALEYPRYEIIVVDNAPATEATAELVRREYGHLAHVRYVREPRPGPASARNRGLTLAHGEIVAFTDDDAIADRFWIAELVRGFGRGPDVTCVTGSIVPRELETPPQILFEQFGGLNKGFSRRIFDATTHCPPDRL